MDTTARIRAVLASIFEDDGQLDAIVQQIIQVLPPPALTIRPMAVVASPTPATGIVTAVAVKRPANAYAHAYGAYCKYAQSGADPANPFNLHCFPHTFTDNVVTKPQKGVAREFPLAGHTFNSLHEFASFMKSLKIITAKGNEMAAGAMVAFSVLRTCMPEQVNLALST